MKKLMLPLSEEERCSLRAGEPVLLSGDIYTARDAAHKRLHELIQRGEPLPFDIHDAVIYYVGPTPAKPGQVIGSAGPTTSSRMDPYTPELIGLGMQGMIGKGRRNKEVIDAVRKHKAVYFVTVGGAGALLSECIVDRTEIAFSDLLSEAVTKLTVRDLPCFVGIDCEGNDIYDMQEQ
ncbi:MAG TPA: Fe-S-containing hydro-lyase [Erysipelotrichaceae bacterium]|nr:Fe-S-containing hydro-lyase [Erysipelotrichaceae bacterium]